MRTVIRKIRHHTVQNFEQLYIDLRKKENRLYTDAAVYSLPEVEASHPLAKEWKIRKHSALRLTQFLRNKKRPLRILEPGCGNGWLSARLAWLPGCSVTGLDINSVELKQARSVFNNTPNLQFMHGDLRNGVFQESVFDIIVIASSIQYFQSLAEIIQYAFLHLADDGEIHILDSPFYRQTKIQQAKERSDNYFSRLGMPQMSNCYFHHSYEVLQSFNHQFAYDPRNILSRWLHQKNPFPWIIIKKSAT